MSNNRANHPPAVVVFICPCLRGWRIYECHYRTSDRVLVLAGRVWGRRGHHRRGNRLKTNLPLSQSVGGTVSDERQPNMAAMVAAISAIMNNQENVPRNSSILGLISVGRNHNVTDTAAIIYLRVYIWKAITTNT
jgi:hypothetical protein